jgi:hypothetical protein
VSRPALPTLRRLPPPWALALAGYVIAIVVVTWPLAKGLGNHTYGGKGDGWALIWQTWERNRYGLAYFSHPVVHNIAWPFGTRPASAVLLSNIVFEWPAVALMRLGVSSVMAYNLVDLGGGVLSSLAMYATLRRFGCRPSVAFWAGLAYLLAPWHLERLAIHPTLAMMASLPLLLLGAYEWARRPGLRSGGIVLGATALAIYSHGYYGFAAAVALAGLLPLVLFASYRHGQLRRVIVPTALLTAAVAAVAAPLAVALAVNSDSVSTQLDRPTYLIELAARPYLWLTPSIDNPILGHLAKTLIGSRPANTGELALYIGWLTLVLIVLAAVAALRGQLERLPVALAVSMFVIGTLFSVPGKTTFPLIGAIKMPVSYAEEHVTFISTPARFFALTLTGGVCAAALGLEWLARRVPRRWPLAVAAAACVISAVELPLYRDNGVLSTNPPAIATGIRDLVPPGQAVMQYPSFEQYLQQGEDQLFYQRVHQHPLVGGAAYGTVEDLVRIAIADSTQPSTARKLALLGVRWASIDPADAGPRSIDTPGFTLVKEFPDEAKLYRVTAKPAPGIVAPVEGFWSDGPADGMHWVTGRSFDVLVCAGQGGRQTLTFSAIGFYTPRQVALPSGRRIELDASAIRPFKLDVPLHRGWQWLVFRLVGSDPTPVSQVVAGNNDPRAIGLSMGRFALRGAPGERGACGGKLPPQPKLG